MGPWQQVEKIRQKQIKNNRPLLSLGDTICVGIVIQEEQKQRTQIFQGTLLSQHRSGRNSTITVRRVFQGVGIERVFFLHSPHVQFITIRRRATVHRGKLYYLRSSISLIPHTY
jgi:large subunit ribosomal protein L19